MMIFWRKKDKEITE